MVEQLFHALIFPQILGLYLLIMAIIMLLRVDFYRTFLMDLEAHSGTIVIGSSFGLILGLMIVVMHNLWVLQPQILVTLIGWLIVIKSILWLTIPERMLVLTRRVYQGNGYYLVVLVAAAIGIILITRGFILLRL